MIPLPKVLHRESGVQVRFDLELEPDHLAFQGHFPGNPILPGVIQVDWAVRLGMEAYGDLGSFCGIHNLKFMEITRPGEPLALTLSWDGAAGKLAFHYEGQKGRKSSGTLLFARS